MCSIKALIVVYNRPLSDSPAFRSLTGITGIEGYVADNSTADYGNRTLAGEAGWQYVSMGGNVGLSKAYNRVIAPLEKNDDVLCLFDDDTTVDSRYFEALRRDVRAYPDIDVFAPVVRDRAGMLSPCIMRGLRVNRALTLEQIPQDAISVINSGLAIRLRVFQDYRYDEGQFLDYIDHAFARDILHHDRANVRIMDVVLQQQFSGSSQPGRQADQTRFAIFKKDIGYFSKKYGISSVSAKRLLIRRRLSLLYRHLLG